MYRAPTQAEAEEKFNAFVQRLPTFVSIAKDVSFHTATIDSFPLFYLSAYIFSYSVHFNATQMYNVGGLQKICDALIENPSWSIAHLVAFFNLTELVANPKVLDLIDYSDHNNCMTPFQVSIILSENVEIIVKL